MTENLSHGGRGSERYNTELTKLRERVDELERQLRAVERARRDEIDRARSTRQALEAQAESLYVRNRELVSSYATLCRRHQRLLDRCNALSDFGAVKTCDLAENGSWWHLVIEDALVADCEIEILSLVVRPAGQFGSIECEFLQENATVYDLLLQLDPNSNLCELESKTVKAARLEDDTYVEDARRNATNFRRARAIVQLLRDVSRATDLPPDFGRLLRDLFSKMEEALVATKGCFRFDSVRVANVQANQDYEHVWLEFANVSVDDRSVGKWDVRIACGALDSAEFACHPRLEFPWSNRDLLPDWYCESEDDYGPKLELRCAYPDQLDVDVWTSLSTEDQKAIYALVEALPGVFDRLNEAGISFGRPASDWANAAMRIKYSIRRYSGDPIRVGARTTEGRLEIGRKAKALLGSVIRASRA